MSIVDCGEIFRLRLGLVLVDVDVHVLGREERRSDVREMSSGL